MSITCEHVDSLLSAWLEGDLGDADRRAVDSHLRECLRCAKIVRDIEAIRHDAANLPEVALTRDLWAGIAARIEAPVIDLTTRQAPARTPQRRNWQMAAAAVLLMAVSSGVTYVLTSNGQRAAGSGQVATDSITTSTPVAVGPNVVVPQRPSREKGSAVLVSSEAVAPEITYNQEITRLRAILDQRRASLDPSTIAVVEQSLRTIDLAIADARAALTTDASSPYLNDQLNRALEKKVSVLRRVALLPVGAS